MKARLGLVVASIGDSEVGNKVKKKKKKALIKENIKRKRLSLKNLSKSQSHS